MAGDNRYRLKVYNRSGNLVDWPADCKEAYVETVINGGSGSGYFTFNRPFDSIGNLDHDFRIQMWLPNSDGTFPTDPYWDGRIVKMDRTQKNTTGEIKAWVEGWFTALDYGIVSAVITPGVQPNGIDNGQLDAGNLISLFANLYAPAASPAVPVTIGVSGPTSIGVNVGQLQWDGAGLSQVLNDITNSIIDTNLSLYDWFVLGKADLSLTIKWRAEQNPNVVSAQWLNLYPGDFKSDYQVVDDSSRIINFIVAYGGSDPSTQQQIWSPYSNSTSISTYGPRQAKTTWSYAASQSQLDQLGAAFLQRYANPQSAGQGTLQRPNPLATAGQWVQIFEAPGVVRQMKITRTEIRITKQRIEQILYLGIPIPSVERLKQGPDPSGSYNAARVSTVKPAALYQDAILGGVTPGWTNGGNIVSYTNGVARIGGVSVQVNGAQTTAINHTGGYSASGSPQTITVNTMSPVPTAGTGVLVDVGANQETVYITAATATTLTGIFTQPHANSVQVIIQQATGALSNGTVTTYLDNTGAIHSSTSRLSAKPGRIILDDFTVLNGAIVGWQPRAPRGGFDNSSPFNQQASVNPFATSSNVTSSATSTSGGSPTSTITVSWGAFTIYWPDGSTTAIASGSTSFPGLTVSTTYWFEGVWVSKTSGNAVVVPSPQTGGMPTVAQEQVVNQDNNVGMISAFSITTPAAGGSGGGGGGKGPTCPARTQLMERKHRETGEIGFVEAQYVEVGDYLPLGDEWKRVYAKSLAPAELVRITVNGKSRDVDGDHVWPSEGKWIASNMLSLTTPIDQIDGTTTFPTSVERLRRDFVVRLSVEGEMYTFDRIKQHNFSIPTQ